MCKSGRLQQSLMSEKKKKEEIWERHLHGEVIEKSLKYRLLCGILQTLSLVERKDTKTALSWAYLLCTRITKLSDISRGEGEMANRRPDLKQV